jgi:hypothetical protein
MAQGTLTLFDKTSISIGDGLFDLDQGTWKVALITNGTVAAATDASPVLATYTQVSGGTSYTAGGEAITVTWTRSGNTTTFKVTSGATTWTQDGSGPTNIYQALVYCDSNTNDDCIGFMDMTADGGTTPISLQAGDVTITWDTTNGIFQSSTA